MAKKKVGIVVGSIRTGSFTRMVAEAMCGLHSDLDCQILEIKQLSMFNQDLEKAPPQDWLDFKAKIKACDAILFATPEYNRSIPGVLKNAIDVGSRPYGQSAWSKKPCAVVSVSPGALAAFGANHHLRQCLVFLEMPALQMETYIGNVSKLFDEKGNLTNADTRAFLQKTIDAFAAWIEATAAKA
jgi:chromate reductase